MGVLQAKCIRELDEPSTVGAILLMLVPGEVKLVTQRRDSDGWQWNNPVLAPFAVSNHDLLSLEVDIFDPEPQTFKQPKAGAFQTRTGQCRRGAGDAPYCLSRIIVRSDVWHERGVAYRRPSPNTLPPSESSDSNSGATADCGT